MSLQRTILAAAALLLAGCSIPFVGGDRKAECDRLAAQAIETESVERARDLAARATDCYARLAM